MNASRQGIYTGAACSLPIIIWMLVQHPSHLNGLEWQATVRLATQALFITLAIAIALVLPWHARHWRWQQNVTGAILLLIVALPVMAIVWLSAAATAQSLLLGLFSLLVFSLLVLIISNGLEILPFSGNVKTLSRGTLQLIIATLVWTFSNDWLFWVGL